MTTRCGILRLSESRLWSESSDGMLCRTLSSSDLTPLAGGLVWGYRQARRLRRRHTRVPSGRLSQCSCVAKDFRRHASVLIHWFAGLTRS